MPNLESANWFGYMALADTLIELCIPLSLKARSSCKIHVNGHKQYAEQ